MTSQTHPQADRSPEDYRLLLAHPDPRVRLWAIERIRHQAPDQAQAWVGSMVEDPDPTVRQQALVECHDPAREDAVWAAETRPWGFGWVQAVRHLGDQGSARAQAFAVQALDGEPGHTWDPLLHWIPDILSRCPASRDALWRFLERQEADGVEVQGTVRALLVVARADDVPRLLRTLSGLDAGGFGSGWSALAGSAGVSRPAEDSFPPVEGESLSEYYEDWILDGVAGLAPEVAERFDASSDPASLVALLEDHARSRALPFQAWLDAWRHGARPKGFRWRSLLAWQVASTLAEMDLDPLNFWPLAVAQALTFQALVDEDDESRLETAGNESETLLAILSSDRMNVMKDVADRVAALGPDAIPRLVHILEHGTRWGQLRALHALTPLARRHPELAVAALPLVLDMIADDESDWLQDPATEVLMALGPRAVVPTAALLGEDDTFDINASSALGEIPCPEAWQALAGMVKRAGFVEEYVLEALLAQGREEAIPLLEGFLHTGGPLLADALCTLGALHGREEAQLARWRALSERGPASAGRSGVAGSKSKSSQKKAARKTKQAQARKKRKRK